MRRATVPKFFQNLAKSRMLKLAALAAGSWKFWCGTALAAITAASVAILIDRFATDGEGSPYQTLGGDRVLLMNGDTKTEPKSPITRQGWADKTVTYDTYWTNYGTTGEDAAPGSTIGPMLQAGTHFELWTKNAGQKLWELLQCRQGNLFPNTNASGTTGLEAIKNYLPYSPNATPANNGLGMQRRYAGNIVFRNTREAQVVSSCYPEGIGTIYFDAVNGFVGHVTGELAVYVARGVWRVDGNGEIIDAVRGKLDDETIFNDPNWRDYLEKDVSGALVPPDEEHCDEVIRNDNAEWITNAYKRCAWERVTLRGKRFGASAGDITERESIVLAETAGQSMDNFYRIWAHVQDNQPMRFRIKRVDNPVDAGYIPEGDLDGKNTQDSQGLNQKYNGLLLLDNVIASLPAMKAGLTAKGEYVKTDKLRNVVGWTGAMSSKYPTIGETGVKASAGVFAVSNNPPAQVGGQTPIDFNANNWVTSAKMMYKWRYLSSYVPETWEEIELDTPTADGRVSTDTLPMTNLVMDCEFYYSAELDAPYYKYVDYSGKDEGTPGYSERIEKVETRLDPEKLAKQGVADQPSGGTDYFFRLREGKSDQLGYVLQVRRADDHSQMRSSDFFLVGDRTWRAFYQTLTNDTAALGAMEFRVVGENPAGCWGGNAVKSLPATGERLFTQEGVTECWTPLTVDSLTGYLMFQLIEDEPTEKVPVPTEMSYSIVHADTADFGSWNAAMKFADDRQYFVGTYVDNEHKTGGSSAAREYPDELQSWTNTVAVSDDWLETFRDPSQQWKPEDGHFGYKAYVEFPSCPTPKGWEATRGQWVCSKYRISSEGGECALQLAGQGEGMVTYNDTETAPQGLESVAVKARLAQNGDFGDFAFYLGGKATDQKEYLLSANMAMATQEAGDDFEGLGTVSLAGYCIPNVGGYEVRAERTGDNTVRIGLFKWYRKGGKMVADALGYSKTSIAFTSGSYLKSSGKAGDAPSASHTYGELFISFKNDTANGKTIVYAGLASGGLTIEGNVNKSHYCVKYEDSSADRYTCGTFGFSTLNCFGRVIAPRLYATAPTVPTSGWTLEKTYKTAGFYYGNQTLAVSGTVTPLFSDLSTPPMIYNNWMIDSSRFEKRRIGDYEAVRALAPKSDLIVEAYKRNSEGKMVWQPLPDGTNTISSFGYVEREVPLRSREKTPVRLRVGGTFEDARTDIVLDRVEMRRWCSENLPAYDGQWSYGCPTNFVYTGGWVNGAPGTYTLDLTPARSQKVNSEAVVSLRSPLMDGLGTPKRGTGLGMLSVGYVNADTNCVVLLQHREVTSDVALKEATEAAAEFWTTDATFAFSNVTDEVRASGTLSHYYGLHGFKGVMRLIIAPQVVVDSAKQSDPDYGKITITSFSCRDEPPMDDRSWWGWNLMASTNAENLLIYEADPKAGGKSIVLNNSATSGISPDEQEKELYPQHVPFVQSPKFFTNLVGEISFRVKKLRATDPDAQVTILGATHTEAPDDQWTVLHAEKVTGTVFSKVTYKAPRNVDYAAFRVAVIAAEDVTGRTYDEDLLPGIAKPPPRIVIDEVTVSEAVRGAVAFKDIGAFRTPLDKHEYVTNLFDIAQQPMCEESWSVQCEVWASQLAEEVALGDDTEVWLYWKEGVSDWGKLGSLPPGAKTAQLARVPDLPANRFVFRGSYPAAPEAVIEPSYGSGTVVQYLLKVKYRMADGTEDEAYLGSGEWTKPAWYRGVDYNAKYGGFSAYTILDTVAYGYAWINEVNVYDGPTPTEDISWTNQFVEVAVPAAQDIENWELKFVTGGLTDAEPMYTNTVATFRSDGGRKPGFVPSSKSSDFADDASKYVFITAGSPESLTPELQRDGIIDGAWTVKADDEHGSQLRSNGELDGGTPIAIQLVRPSGVIEHEFVIAGTNRYATRRDPYPRTYSTTNYLARLKAAGAPETMYIACDDTGDRADYASGVTDSEGAVTNAAVWAHLKKTPGRINVGERVVPAPLPQGSMVVLYAKLENGYLEQTIGSAVRTNHNIVIYVPKGLKGGTNITYTLTSPWHEVATITETVAGRGTRTAGPFPGQGTVTFTVADNVSNEVEVVAASRVRQEIIDEGVPEVELPAVMAWLEGKRGPNRDEAFRKPGEIHHAEYRGIDGELVESHPELSLEEMFWLDIDPTITGTVYQAGMCEPGPAPVVIKEEGEEYEDVIVNVMGKIWNRYDEFEPYPPYTLNGIEPGSTSMDSSLVGWNGVTFKVEGFLLNGKQEDTKPWMPLRYFVFDRLSFGDDFKAKIQIVDPFFQVPSWKRYVGSTVIFRTNIGLERSGAWGLDVLRPDSTFDE